MGDFNLPNVDLGTFIVHSHLQTKFMTVCFWTQHVSEHTRFRANQVPSCLDWVISDDPNILEELQYDVHLGKSDNECLKWQISF